MRDEDKPGTTDDSGIEDVSSTIRSLIENEASALPSSAPEPSKPKIPAQETKPVPDRWADLRAKFAELDEEDDEDFDEGPLPASASVDGAETPLEAVQRRAAEAEATARPDGPSSAPEASATEAGEPEIAHYFEDAPQPVVTPEPEPEPVPQEMTRSDWDSPEDHVMSKRARTVWRVAVYGTLVALPASFFALSPFGPRDTVQHHVSAIGCQFAALFDYENIEEGAPGYHAHLDEDADGIACEVKRSRIAKGGGFSGFRSP